MRRALALIFVTIAVFVVTVTSASGTAGIYHERVSAAAEVTYSTCPWDAGAIPVGSICTDTFVLAFQAQRIYTPDQFHQVGQQPWVAFVSEHTYRYDGNNSITDLHIRFGATADAEISVDVPRLLTAHAAAVIPMDDGTQYALDLNWDMAGTQLNTAGIDGPIEGGTWGTHHLTDCSMTNLLAHQTWRWKGGSVTGTLDGVDVNTLQIDPSEPFVGRGVFTFTSSTHGECLG